MKRYYYMDILTILATIAVVFLHTSEYAFSNQTGDSHWVIAVILQVTFIWAVPIFFMMSGAHLLDYRERYDTVTFFKKRMTKVFVPFIFWSFVWYILNPFIFHQPPDYHIGQFIDAVMHNSIQPIFWFFYFVIGFYISAPLLAKITNKADKTLALYLLVVNMVFVNILSYYYEVRLQTDNFFLHGIQIGAAGGVGFFVVGWYLKNTVLHKWQKNMLYVAALASVAIMIALTIYLSIKRGKFAREVYDIWGLFGFILSIGVFEFVKSHLATYQPSPKVQLALQKVASTSLGVYVIHEFFIYFAERKLHIADSSLKHMFILPIIVWLASTALVLIIHKIPLLNKIV
ncbi:MAG TPA: acyltransferase [Leuconostoc mesenteroides]|nr:acyltransferase [Leuconostoc mesenteroides]